MSTVTLESDGVYMVKGKKWSELDPRYELIDVLGSGAYGCVCRAKDRESPAVVAIKRIEDVFISKTDALRILREIAILRRLDHPNVVKLVNVVKPPAIPAKIKSLYVIFEYAGIDLHKLAQIDRFLTTEEIKFITVQICQGLLYLHQCCVIHRDLKPANILIHPDTLLLKIADFGLSRVGFTCEVTGGDAVPEGEEVADGSDDDDMDMDEAPAPLGGGRSTGVSAGGMGGRRNHLTPLLVRSMSEHVVTRWYRAPEVILCRGHYAQPIDVWSVGCILAELLNLHKDVAKKNRRPLFPGRSCFPLSPSSNTCYKDAFDQLNVIFQVIGTPTQEEVLRLDAQQDVKSYLSRLHPSPPTQTLASRFPHADAGAVSLLEGLIRFDAGSRTTLEQALEHPFLAGVSGVEEEMDMDAPPEGLRRAMSSHDIALSRPNPKDELLALDLEHQYDRRNHDEAVAKLSALFRREIDGLHAQLAQGRQ